MSEAIPETTPEPAAPDTAEADARAKGWVPKDEFKGKNWKPADEWLRDGDEMAALRRELKETKDAFLDFGRQNREAALKEAREKRDAELDAAVEAGDKDAARAAADKIKQLDRPPEPELSPPAKAFIDRNKEWFGFHVKATDLAHSLSRRYDSEGLPPEEGLARVQEALQERFPELFTSTQRDRAAAVDTGGTVRTRKKAGHGYHVTDLPEQYQKIAKDFIKRGVITEEKYIQDLIDSGAVRIQ